MKIFHGSLAVAILAAGLVTCCTGCDDIATSSARSTEKQQAAGRDDAVPISKEAAIEVAKRAIIAREKWTANGWPANAPLFANESEDGWGISAFPPPDLKYKASHVFVMVDRHGKVTEYTYGW